MIALKNISHTYSENLTIGFKEGEFTRNHNYLILGKSGSGKSTLINIMTGLLRPTGGTVWIDDVDIYGLKEAQRDKFRAERIGIVFQRPHFLTSLTVTENLKLTQSLANQMIDKIRINEVLNRLAILDKKDEYPNSLSVGQLQRLSIARAILNKPNYIIADEPTSSLDDKNTDKVLSLLIEQSEAEQASLIVATHDKRVKDLISNIYSLEGEVAP